MTRREVAALLARTSVRAGAKPMAAPTAGQLSRRSSLPMAMSLAEAVAIAGSLGVPSKMPGFSYGLDAKRCEIGSQMVKVSGSICAGCFALNDFYASYRPAIIARERRHAGLEHPRWCDAMVRQILHYCRPPRHHFRWHDSGDLQSFTHALPDGSTMVDMTSHLSNIVRVCERTPEVWHWMPTREYAKVEAFLAAGGVIPPNLCVRLSALMVDSEPPHEMPAPAEEERREVGEAAYELGQLITQGPPAMVIPPALAHLTTSTVHTPGAPIPVAGKGSIECRAVELRDNQCGECRACWDNRVRCVSYPQH